MRCARMLVVSLCTLAASTVNGLAQELTDPYEVLSKYIQATGGRDRLLGERTSYSEGDLTYGGMEGTIKVWTARPSRLRAETVLGPFTLTQGNDGTYDWVVDQNGKLQVTTNPDEATLKRRRVRELINEYAFADPESDVFTAALSGIEQVDGKSCYVIRVANSINVDTYTAYINTGTFILEKAVFIEDDESRDTFYGDYREVQGIRIPYSVKDIQHTTGQEILTRLTLYESNPPIDDAMFAPPEQGAKDYEFVAGDRAEDIPFEYVDNHLYLPAIVNGKERLWILDTGADITVLNKSFAEELKLPLEGTIKGNAAGGSVDVNLTTLPPFSVEGIRFQGQTVGVIDMTELIRRLGVDIAGILGYDFLSRFVTKVDYASHRVSFYDPQTFAYAGGGHELGIHFSGGHFEVPATLDGVHTGNWLFDIGAGSTDLHGAFGKKEGYADRPGVLRMLHGAGSEFLVKQVTCDSMLFAGFTLYKPLVSVPYGGTDTTFTADRIGGLGNSLFQNFVLYCDYAGERLIVEKGENFNQPPPIDRSGLQIAWSYDREVEVTYVSPETPGEKAGFKKGDLIRSINGIDVTAFDGIVAIRRLFKAEPGTGYACVVDRAGKESKLTLTLAELL